VAIVGGGRLGGALACALQDAGAQVQGPLGRGASPAGVDAVLLCVPDCEIASAAALIPDGETVGHCSGATGLEAIGRPQAFSVHPLMTIAGAPLAPAPGAPNPFAGAAAAVAGSTPAALALAERLARLLGMRPLAVAEADRAAYHAAASIASNFLVALEAAAERLAATAGVRRCELAPLVRATVENWEQLGPERALTGPIARGDLQTVARQRAAVSERAPDLLAMFDAMVKATAALAAAGAPR